MNAEITNLSVQYLKPEFNKLGDRFFYGNIDKFSYQSSALIQFLVEFRCFSPITLGLILAYNDLARGNSKINLDYNSMK